MTTEEKDELDTASRNARALEEYLLTTDDAYELTSDDAKDIVSRCEQIIKAMGCYL